MSIRLLARVSQILLAFLLLPFAAQADIGEFYGFGSRSAALAGTGASEGHGAFASYYNPAALTQAAIGDRRLTIDLGLLYMSPTFLPISNVVTVNTWTGGPGATQTGDVDTSYRETWGQLLALSYRILDSPTHLTAGVTTFLPINQLAYLDTGEVYEPEYVLYRARTQRPQIEFGLGGDLSPALHLGFGLHFAFGLTSNATVFLQSASATAGPSTMRFIASMKAKLSPYFGIQYTPEFYKPLRWGLVLRLSSTSDNSMTLRSAAQVGFPSPIDFSFLATSALFYDPLALELGVTWEHFPGWKLMPQIDYQAWSAFQIPALVIQSCTSASEPGCGVFVSNTVTPTFNFQNIVIPRVSEEVQLGSWMARLGYAYRPSILAALPTGIGNYLDPPKHLLSAGIGKLFPHLFGGTVSAQLDFHLAYHILVTQHIDKTPGDETGNTASSKIGAPGYDAGGKILGGGVSLSLAI